MKNIEKKYKLIPLKNGDFQLDIPVIKSLPDIKLYIKNHGEYLGIYDGGTTIASIFMLFDLSSQEFQNKVFEICKANKISKEKNVFFIETYKKDFDERLKNFITALHAIVTIR